MGRLKRRGSRGRLIPGGLRCEGQFGVHREEGGMWCGEVG